FQQYKLDLTSKPCPHLCPKESALPQKFQAVVREPFRTRKPQISRPHQIVQIYAHRNRIIFQQSDNLQYNLTLMIPLENLPTRHPIQIQFAEKVRHQKLRQNQIRKDIPPAQI